MRAVFDFLFIATLSGAGFPSLTALVSRYNFVLAMLFIAGILQFLFSKSNHKAPKMCKYFVV